jgi:hypothetical protein
MQATAIHPISTFDPRPAGPYQSIVPLLDLTLTQTNAQGAYIYRFEAADGAAQLAVWTGLSPDLGVGSLRVEGRAARAHFGRQSPIVLQDRTFEDWRFGGFPEFQRHRFEGVTSIPLINAGVVVGIANICRLRSAALQPRELAFLLSLSLPIGALMASERVQDDLQREVRSLAQQLADRKLIERAKGLLQSGGEITEEEAYFRLRRLSRQRRVPMREIASEIISGGVQQAGA